MGLLHNETADRVILGKENRNLTSYGISALTSCSDATLPYHPGRDCQSLEI